MLSFDPPFASALLIQSSISAMRYLGAISLNASGAEERRILMVIMISQIPVVSFKIWNP
jgi:hypothetical protein